MRGHLGKVVMYVKMANGVEHHLQWCQAFGSCFMKPHEHLGGPNAFSIGYLVDYFLQPWEVLEQYTTGGQGPVVTGLGFRYAHHYDVQLRWVLDGHGGWEDQPVMLAVRGRGPTGMFDHRAAARLS